MSKQSNNIVLRGVEVHNLRSVDLDLPRDKLIVFCGVSGSGKSSLALDTLHAEGQRRYIESFSAHARGFLERIEKPQALRIEGIPPAVAVVASDGSDSNRSTLATATETADYLRLLFAKVGKTYCNGCGCLVRIETPQTVAKTLSQLEASTRFTVGFSIPYVETIAKQLDDVPASKAKTKKLSNAAAVDDFLASLVQAGYVRAVRKEQTYELTSPELAAGMTEVLEASSESLPADAARIDVILDRLRGDVEANRLFDSIETAFTAPESSELVVYLFDEAAEISTEPRTDCSLAHRGRPQVLDGKKAKRIGFSQKYICDDCSLVFTQPVPRLFSFNSPLGACPRCEGFGNVMKLDWELLFPDPSLSLTRGAAVFAEGSMGKTWKEKMLTAGKKIGIPVDIPLVQLSDEQLQLLFFGEQQEGDDDKTAKKFAEMLTQPVTTEAMKKHNCRFAGGRQDGEEIPEREVEEYGKISDDEDDDEEKNDASQSGIALEVPANGDTEDPAEDVDYEAILPFFAKLEKRKYKMHVRAFLSRYRSFQTCPLCSGQRLREEALAVKLAGKSVAEVYAMKIVDALAFLEKIDKEDFSDYEKTIIKTILEQVLMRLKYLQQVGLGYLTLSRPLRTLSGGERRRATLASALGSDLVGMLYILDEPSVGLHPHDLKALLASVVELRKRGNTVIVVEHEETFINAAEEIVEIGPGAGAEGGRIVFQGSNKEILEPEQSLTGDYLAGRRGASLPTERRPCENGWLRLSGASGHNLKDVNVEFPLGVFCAVTGVSGAGKSSLVQQTFYPALRRRLGLEAPTPLPFDEILGAGQIDEVILVDQSSIGKTPRSNPVTYIKAFDEIRNVFAQTSEARAKNFTASCFSFNTGDGRCPVCNGDGMQRIDMQLLADVMVPCPECDGKRYRDEILEVTYRGRNIAEVLAMTVREAVGFFRGQHKVLSRLTRLLDVSLDYLQLGQPATTLSGGESQRLKLASYLSTAKRGHCLFILDEPTTGLHFRDIVQLLDCFDALLDVGHSLIVIEHNLQIVRAADWVIDLGPGASERGGEIVAVGTPEMIAKEKKSRTAEFLKKTLK